MTKHDSTIPPTRALPKCAAEALDIFPTPALLLDAERTIVAHSSSLDAARTLGAKCHTAMHGHEAPCAGCPLDQAARTGRPVDADVRDPDTDRSYRARILPTPWRGETGPLYLHLVDDTTTDHLLRRRVERSAWTQSVLNDLLRLSLRDASFDEFLGCLLDRASENPELEVEGKGAIFTVREGERTLEMVAARGLSAEMRTLCARVPFGRCLCGRAARSREMVFASHVDERHDLLPTEWHDHGHYSVPMVLDDETVGVLVLYVEAGQARIEDYEGFFRAVGDVLAGAVRRRRAVAAIDLAGAIETAREGVAIIDRSGIVQFANSAFLHIAGRSGRLESGTRLPDLLDLEERDLVKVESGLAAGTSWSGRVERGLRLGGARQADVLISPVLGGDGLARRFIGLARDVTREAELQAQLHQAQKMEAVGRLAGGIAHDFNNILSVIISYADLARAELPGRDPLRDDLDQIHAAGQRAAALTRKLLAFSRKEIAQPQVVDLEVLVADLEKMLRRIIGEDIRLRTSFARGAPLVFVDPGLLEQSIINLVVNARDAMPDGGEISIELTAHDESGQTPGLMPGPYAQLVVSDTGHGMPPEVLQHVFEPFFTTKEAGKGTGLGLATVYGIVEHAGGTVRVESAPGDGTSFRLYLPRCAEERASEAAGESSRHSSSAPVRAATILVVEDDPAVRAIIGRTLARRGFTVVSAAHPGEALLTVEQHRGPIDLLLTDVIMPGLSGPELVARLRDTGAGFGAVLFMSGYTGAAIDHPEIRRADRKVLGKPFTPDGLYQAVREALERAA